MLVIESLSTGILSTQLFPSSPLDLFSFLTHFFSVCSSGDSTGRQECQKGLYDEVIKKKPRLKIFRTRGLRYVPPYQRELFG